MQYSSPLSHLGQNWLLLLSSTSLGILISILLLFIVPYEYEAKALLQIGKVSEQDIESSLNTVQRLKSISFQEKIAQLIHRKHPNQDIISLKKDLKKTSVELIKNTDIITITLTANSANIAKERIEYYINLLSERHLTLSKPIHELYKQQLAHAQNKLQSLNTSNMTKIKSNALPTEYSLKLDSNNEAIYWNQQIFTFQQALTPPKTQPTSLLEPIVTSEEPIYPKKIIFILLGSLLGFIFGILYALRSYKLEH